MSSPPFDPIRDPRATLSRWVVAPDKLRRYLLDLTSQDGAAKAARFLRHNFTADTLGSGLAEHGRNGRLARVQETFPYGTKFEVVEPLSTPLDQGNHLKLI